MYLSHISLSVMLPLLKALTYEVSSLQVFGDREYLGQFRISMSLYQGQCNDSKIVCLCILVDGGLHSTEKHVYYYYSSLTVKLKSNGVDA